MVQMVEVKGYESVGLWSMLHWIATRLESGIVLPSSVFKENTRRGNHHAAPVHPGMVPAANAEFEG